MDEDRPLPVELPAPVLKQAQRRISWPQTVNVRFPSMGITGRANREGRMSSHLGRSPQLSRLVSCPPGSGYAARVRVSQDFTIFGTVTLAFIGSQHARVAGLLRPCSC